MKLRYRVIVNIPAVRWMHKNWRTVIVRGSVEHAAIAQAFLGDAVIIEQG